MVSKYTPIVPVKCFSLPLVSGPMTGHRYPFPPHLRALGSLFQNIPRPAASASSAGTQPEWLFSGDSSSKCSSPNRGGNLLLRPTYKTHARDLYKV